MLGKQGTQQVWRALFHFGIVSSMRLTSLLGFIAGASLSQWAKERKATAREAAELLATLADAVSYAHEHGVVHRDIKPANVMIDRESGQPMLMDFGLAKDMADTDAQLTHDGAILGTPAYMAPEQAVGDQTRIGPHSDISVDRSHPDSGDGRACTDERGRFRFPVVAPDWRYARRSC